MASNSMALSNFRDNVRDIIRETPGLSILKLVELMNARRRESYAESPPEKEMKVSRTFINNMLNGKFDCSVGLAEEIAAVLGVPLPVLISDKKNLRQSA